MVPRPMAIGAPEPRQRHASKDAQIRADRLRGEPRAGGPQGARPAGHAATATSRPSKADVVVALGGDGLMLRTLHKAHEVRQADLRHAPRHRRLPDERVPREGPARAAGRRADHRHPSAGHARARHQGQAARALTPSTRSRCSARPIRWRGWRSSSTARSGCRN